MIANNYFRIAIFKCKTETLTSSMSNLLIKKGVKYKKVCKKLICTTLAVKI